MYPVTNEFLAAVRQSHVAPVTAEVWSDDVKVLDVYPNSGSVSVDSRRAIRRTCSVQLVDSDGTLTPTNAYEVLTPFGSELRLYRGVRIAGEDYMIPLGVFVITDVEVSAGENGASIIQIEGADRSIRISRSRFVDSYQITQGTNLATALDALLKSRWADVDTDFINVDTTTGNIVLDGGADSDPWKSAFDLAESAGLDLYFDVDGVVKLRAIPDPAGAVPDATYEDNDEAVLLGVRRRMTVEGTYNGVIVISESSTSNTIRSQAWDEDPESPTYRYGPFGQVPRWYVTSFINTQAQADNTAASLLQKELGAQESIEWTQVVNPAHDVFDIVQIENSATKTSATLILDALDIPLSAESSMSAKARVRTV